MAPVAAVAQEAAPVVEWQHHDFYDQLPKGTHYVDLNGVLVPEDHSSATPITANFSGGDWWMDVKAVNNLNGTAAGYVAVGYSGAQNWGYIDGCYEKLLPSLDQDARQMLQTDLVRRGETREAVALYDLNGTRLWYRSFYGGVFEGVIQDSEGNIVICGGASNSNYQFFDDIADPKQLWLNPANSSSQTLLPTSGCVGPQSQMIVMKMDLSGNVIWNHLFNPSADANVAITRRTGGYDLVETNKNGTKGYRIAGNAYPLVGGVVSGANRPYLVQLDLGGYKAWDHVIEQVDVYWPAIGSNPVYTNAIDRVLDATTLEEHFVLSGVSWPYPAPTSAWLMYFKEPATASAYVPFDWIVDTHVDEAQFPLVADPLAHQISTDVTFKVESGVEKIIFPVVANITGSWYAGGHYALNSPIYKLSSSSPHVVEAHTDLGELHAFDFRLGVTVTSDQNIVAVCTKWPDGFSVAGDHYGYDDLNANVQSCLTGYPLVNWSQTNPNQIPGCYYYWGSQSYATKLNASDLSEMWHYQWNDPYTIADDCFPGNVRRRQCNFRVVEAEDGGLVVCGNTGHNFDDAYLAKLKEPCSFTLEHTMTYACPVTGGTNSIAVSVVGGTGPFTYQWTNGASTSNIGNLTPGSYSVLVTDQGEGCATSATYTIYGPLTLDLDYHTLCIDGDHNIHAVVTGGSGEFYYALGYHPTGTPYGSGPVFPPPGIDYYFYVTDLITGCTTFMPVGGSNEPFPVASSSITPAACALNIQGAISLNMNTAYAPYSFLWTTGATTEDVTGLEAGTYSVTVSYGLTCSSTYTYTVPETDACCPADLVIPNGTYSSSLPSSVSGSVDIRGQFILDDDFQFAYAQIYMEPGAEIIVLPDVHLNMGYSTMESCSNTMWKSITANEGSLVYIRESTMSDAENVVTALRGANIVLIQDLFRDNRNSLYVPEIGFMQWNDVGIYMTDNLFTSTGALAQPYPGQTTAVGRIGYAAVEVYNTYADLTGGGNEVDRMSNGIIGHRSDVVVSDFGFKNVKPDAAYAYIGNGSGIFAQGDHSYHKLVQQGYGQGGAPSFENCQWGIFTRYMTVWSEQNNMQGVGTAYRVESSRNRYVDILSNQVHALYQGIDLRMNQGAVHVLVQDNDITFGDVSNPFLPLPCFGIIVNEYPGENPDSKILNNTIHYVPKYTSFVGIGLLATDKWLVAENELDMVSNIHNRWGIAISGARFCELSCNNINGAATTYPADGQAGIYSNMGEGQRFSCNVIDKTSNGALFNGVASNINLSGNQFHQHKWGLHLSSSAIIGGQDHKGNLWYDAPAQGGLGAWYEPQVTNEPNPNASLNPFLYNPAIISGGNTMPTTWVPLEWFQPFNGPNYDCAITDNGPYCEQFHAMLNGYGITELDHLIAKDSLQNDPYTLESKYMLKGSLYKKLDEDPVLRNSDQELADFYNDLQGSTTDAFKSIDDSQKALNNMDSNVVVQVQANRAQIEILMDSVKAGMVQMDDSTLTDAQRSTILSGLSGYRSTIGTLTAWNNSALQLAATTKVLTAESIKAANTNVGTTKLIESNEKQVNEIYLSTVGKDVDTFTVAQTNSLFYIANQCPMVGGNSVYRARSLYRLIDDEQQFDDPMLCLQHGIIVKSLVAREVNTVGVVPNPARDGATLVLGKPLEETGTFILFNTVGVEVMRLDVPAEEYRMSFVTSGLASGVYQYRVVTSLGLEGNGKLSIIH